ncbi:amidase [Naasia lichenicola]|uniref:Amidase n=1 Tax=Naasia lichenicola TaxID=2565933 RepID=A0A4S4FM91_9MICO|nr:amidase [Naasia lichenicola]
MPSDDEKPIPAAPEASSPNSSRAAGFDVVERSIAELRAALESGEITSVDLVAAYLNRIAHFDRQGIRLNAVPVLNPDAFADARASDARRARSETLGPLDGIPYTAKDSYKARGLTVASGSPAFEHLTATDDAFTIGRLRAAGAVLIGLTNMPPMANGGMQRGVYGRAESPYNADYLTAAYASGSSNGSGTATAASFAAFGLGEETWSSGRAPASNNGLVAYTPSRGIISMRGNWPLVPTMDVVVPHARSAADLLEILDVIVADDPDPRGDFWRMQQHIPTPPSSALRPASYPALGQRPDALRGVRLGVPRMYINADPDGANPIETRKSVLELWRAAAAELEALGAEVVEVDFPVVSNYEEDRPGARSMVTRGLVSADFHAEELGPLSVFGMDDFLRANDDPALNRLDQVDGALIFPLPPGTIADLYSDDPDIADYPGWAADGVRSLDELPLLGEALRGIEETRRVDLEQWMDERGLAAVIFPAAADVGPEDAERDPESHAKAWRNGVWVSNGNVVIRHLGIPTVTVPMGVMADIGMPVGLTFAGRGYDDSALLTLAAAFDMTRGRRIVPPRTPSIPAPTAARGDAPVAAQGAVPSAPPSIDLTGSVTRSETGALGLSVQGRVVGATGPFALELSVDGRPVQPLLDGDLFTASVELPADAHSISHSVWREPYGSLVIVVVKDARGVAVGAVDAFGGIG